MKKLLWLLVFSVPVFAQVIDPRTQINWPRLSGSGTPVAAGFGGDCGTHFGQSYTDKTGNHFWICGASGWFQIDGLGNTTNFKHDGSTLGGAFAPVGGVQTYDYDETSPAADAGFRIAAGRFDSSTGKFNYEVPASTPPALQIGITPPDSNQGVFIPFTSFNINRIDPCGLITSASQDATSGAILSAPGTLICHNSEAIFNWTTAVLPAGIPAANVTSVQAVASYQLLEGGLSFVCNGVSLPPTPDIPFSQQMIVLPGITGTNIGTASCSLDMIQSLAGTIMDGSVSQIGLWVEYTGTPVADPSLKVQYPLLYTSYDNTLSINSYWPNSVTALKVADLPAASTFQAGPGFPQYLVKDLVDDTYGVAAVGGGTKYGWVQSNGSGYTVSSGFANTLENGFVGDVPYQTGPNRTAFVHPGTTPGHTYALGWKAGMPAVVQGAGCGSTCTFSNPVTAGDLIFVLTSDTATIAPVGCGISDSFGTIYTLQQSSGNVVKTYTGIAATSGNVVISLTGADASHCYGSIAEITGADATTPVDVNGSVVSGLGTSVNPTITTTLNNDLLIAWEGLTNSAPVTITPSAGLTFIGGTGNNTYATNSWSAPGATAGAYSATFTSSGPSGVYAFYGGIVGIKASASGGATDPVAIDLGTSVAGVSSLNTLTGGLSLASSDSSITITPSGSTIDLKAVGGGGGVGGTGTAGWYALWATSTTLGNGNLDDGITTASTITAHEAVNVVCTGCPTQVGLTYNVGHAPAGSAGSAVLAPDTTGNLDVNENNTGFARVCTATNGICTTGGGPSGTNGVIQIANTAGTAFDSDSTISINKVAHTVNIGTLPTNHVSIGALGTPTAWNFDTTSPTTAALSVGGGTAAAGKYIDGGTGAWTTLPGSGTVTTTGTPASGDIAAFSGSTSITTATATQINTLLKNLTGCNTATYLYSPQSGTCVAPAAGNYQNLGGTTTWTNCTYASGVCTTTGSVASVTISGIPSGYFRIEIDSATSTTNSGGADMLAQFNSDTGSNYVWSATYTKTSSTTPPSPGGSNSATSMHVCAVGSPTANENGSGIFVIVNYAGSQWKHVQGRCGNYGDASGEEFGGTFTGAWKGTAAITSITLTPSAGSFQSGSTFAIHGVN